MRSIAALLLADRLASVPAADRAAHVGGLVASLLDLPSRPIVVVLGETAESVIEGADLDEATVVVNPEWRSGRSSSLRAGFDVLGVDRHVEAALVAVAGRPAVDERVASALLQRFGRDSRLVVPKYRYEYDFPVVVGRLEWDRIVEGSGELLTFVNAHRNRVEEVWVDDLAPGRRRVAAPGRHWQGNGPSG
jgi:CTP:molybdopterin cytidylyltransferase MocA